VVWNHERRAIKHLIACVFVVPIFWYFKPHAPTHINSQARVVVKTASIDKPIAKVPVGVKKANVTVQEHIGKKKPPASKPKPQVVLTGCSSYRRDFNQYDWNVHVAEAICEAESNGNPNAISPPNYDGLRDYGLMQLHGEPILNPARNIAAAYRKYQTQGWEAWTTYNTGRYVSYLE
jgi:hypothetical protein